MRSNQLLNRELIFPVLLDVTVIILLSLVLGLLANQFRTNRLSLVADWSPEARLVNDSGESLIISLEEAKVLCTEKGAVFLDARSPEDYGRGHIFCAKNIPWQAFDEYISYVWNTIPEDAWIVAYCDGETCSLSENLAKELVSMGYTKVRVLLNGWTRWREAGLPINRELQKKREADYG